MPGPIGLALSGGGFRATLYHLGVVRFLREAGLLPRVSHLCSVSGGSIFAAHLVLEWERYTGTEQEFEAAAAELVAFTRRDLRANVMRSWAFSYAALYLPRLFDRAGWVRTGLLRHHYDSLYRGATLKDLMAGPGGKKRPALHLLTTSMTTGHLVSFGDGQMTVHDGHESEGYPARRSQDPSVSTRCPAGGVPVSLAVAASSAFPPLFPPVRVTPDLFGPAAALLGHDHFLADGGVFDNLGIRKLLWVNREERADFDLVVVSDAQRETRKELANWYRFIWSRAIRSSDLLMSRVSYFEDDAISRLCAEANSELLRCQLQSPVPAERADALSEAEQTGVRQVRTDLDAFTADEVNALVHQGAAVARMAWAELRAAGKLARVEALPGADRTPARDECWHPLPAAPAFALGRSDRRSWGLFNPSHLVGWGLWSLLALYFLGLPGGCFVWQSRQLAQANRLAAEAKKRDEERRAVDRMSDVIQKLTDVSLARSTEERAQAKDAWKECVTSLPPEFVSGADIGEDLQAIDEKLAGGAEEGLEGLPLNLARKLGRWGQGSLGPGFLERMKALRERLFDDAVKAAQAIAREENVNQVPFSRQKFWKLYWGEMGMVEGDDVVRAMAKFGDLLRPWEAPGRAGQGEDPGTRAKLRAGLVERADALKKACDGERNGPLPFEGQ